MRRLKLSGDELVSFVGTDRATIAIADWSGESAEGAGLAISIPNDFDLGALGERAAAALGDAAEIHLSFPHFKDGRAYSQARLLRERMRFRGALVAIGDLLPDQLFFLSRCGFDAFQSDTLRAGPIRGFSAVYQASSDARAPVFAQRRGRARKAA